MPKFVFLVVAGFLALITAGRADAQATWNVSFTIPTSTPTFNVHINAANETVYAGAFNAHVNSPSGVTPSNFLSYCVDILRENSNPDTYNVTPLSSPPASEGISTAQWGRLSWLYENYGAAPLSVNQSSAVQLSMWYILGGNSASNTVTGTGGLFWVNSGDSSIISLANTYLSASLGQSSSGALYLQAVHTPTTSDNQSMIGPLDGNVTNQNVTPEAGAIPMLTAGLSPIGMFLLRRRQLSTSNRPTA